MITVLQNSLFILNLLVILANSIYRSKIIRIISILFLGYYISLVMVQPLDLKIGAFIASLFLLFTYFFQDQYFYFVFLNIR
jgi:hypothetical protein